MIKNLRWFVASVFLASCLPSSVSAEGLQVLGTLTRTEFSVTKVMMKAGCDLNWLSQVVADSKIDPRKLRELPLGLKISFGGSCKNLPSAEVKAYSLILLRLDENSRLSKEFNAQIAALREAEAAKSSKYESVASENGKLKLMVSNLQAELTKKIEELKAVASKAEGFKPILLLFSFLIGATVASIASYSLFLWFGRNKVSFPLKWKITEQKKEYEFSLVGIAETVPGNGVWVGLGKCPCCPEKRVYGRERNLRAHIKEKHPEERVTLELHPDFKSEAGVSV